MTQTLVKISSQVKFLTKQLYLELCLLPDKVVSDRAQLIILQEAKSLTSNIERKLSFNNKSEHYDLKVTEKDLIQLGMYLIHIIESFSQIAEKDTLKIYYLYSRIANSMNSRDIVDTSNLIHSKIYP